MTFRACHSLCVVLAAVAGVPAFGQFGANQPPPNPADALNLRFANGIVAVAEDKIITVADVTREIAPLFQQLQAEAKSQKELDDRLATLQDSVIQDLIDRVLIIKEFKKDEKKHMNT